MRKIFSLLILFTFFFTLIVANKSVASIIYKEQCKLSEERAHDGDTKFFTDLRFSFNAIPYTAQQMRYENVFFDEMQMKFEDLWDLIKYTDEELRYRRNDFNYQTKYFIESVNKDLKPFHGEFKDLKVSKAYNMQDTANYFFKYSTIASLEQIYSINLLIYHFSKIYYLISFLSTFHPFEYTNENINSLDGAASRIAWDSNLLPSKTFAASDIFAGIFKPEIDRTISAKIPFYQIDVDNLSISQEDSTTTYLSFSNRIIKNRLKARKDQNETDLYFTENSYEEQGEYEGISKYKHAIPGDIVLNAKLIKYINLFLLTYVELLMEMEELDLLLYSNQRFDPKLLQDYIQKISTVDDFSETQIYEKKVLVDSIKRAVKSSIKIRSLFSTLDKSFNKIHNEIISQRENQYNYKTALKNVIKNSFLARESCENFVEEYNESYIKIMSNEKYSSDKKKAKILQLLKSSSFKKIISYSKAAERYMSKLCLIDAEIYDSLDGEVKTPQREEIKTIYNALNRYMKISADLSDNDCVTFGQADQFSNAQEQVVDNNDYINQYPEVQYYPEAAKELHFQIYNDSNSN